MRKGYLIRRSWTAGCAERCLSGAGESWNETCCREAARRFLRLTFRCWHATALHFHPTPARVESPALVWDQVVQVGEPHEKGLLAATRMMQPFHHEELPLNSIMGLIQQGAGDGHLRVRKHRIPARLL